MPPGAVELGLRGDDEEGAAAAPAAGRPPRCPGRRWGTRGRSREGLRRGRGGGGRAGRETGASARRGDIAARAGGNAVSARAVDGASGGWQGRAVAWRARLGFSNTHPDILRGERRGYPQQGLEGPAQGDAYRAHNRADDPHEHHSPVARSPVARRGGSARGEHLDEISTLDVEGCQLIFCPLAGKGNYASFPETFDVVVRLIRVNPYGLST